jgi:hypothetical protein
MGRSGRALFRAMGKYVNVLLFLKQTNAKES